MPSKTRSDQAGAPAKTEEALQRVVSEKLLIGIDQKIKDLLDEAERFREKHESLQDFPNRNRFNALRSSVGISIEQLAEVTGVKVKTLGNVELQNRPMSLLLAQKYLNGLTRICESIQASPRAAPKEEFHWLAFPKKRECDPHQRNPWDPFDALVEYSGSALSELVTWCYEPADLLIRSVQCYAGTGKTRLGVELCRAIKAKDPDPSWNLAEWNPGGWTAGFLCADKIPTAFSHWTEHDFSRRSVLIVVDEDSPTSRTEMLKRLLPGVLDIPKQRLRIVILGRSQRWLERLRTISPSSRTVNHPIFKKAHTSSEKPSLIDETRRKAEFSRARDTYVNFYELRERPPGEKEFLKAMTFSEPQFGRIAILHLTALAEAERFQLRDNESSILEDALNRERGRWQEGLREHELDPVLLSVVEQVYWKLSCIGGVSDRMKALNVGEKIKAFKTLPIHTKEEIVEMLHQCYEGPRWYIEPLSPDRLNRFFLANQR